MIAEMSHNFLLLGLYAGKVASNSMSYIKASQQPTTRVGGTHGVDERDQELMKMIKEANLQFDQIFCKVAASRSYNEFPADHTVQVPASLFTESQKVGIVRLAGYYKSIEDHLQHRILDQIQHAAGLTSLQAEIKKRPINYCEVTELKKTVKLLQEYLVNEITLREEAEQKTSNLEQEIVKIIEDKNKLEKKLNQSQAVSTSDRPQRPKTGGTASGFIGCYIRKEFNRKPFFGVVANFDHPFYQIVYEDADYEDLALADMEKVLWRFNVPQKKQEACLRHAKKLDLLHSSLLRSGVLANGQADLGHGSSSSGAAPADSNGLSSSPSIAASQQKTPSRTSTSTSSGSKHNSPMPSSQPSSTVAASQSSSVLDGVMKGFKVSSIIGKLSMHGQASESPLPASQQLSQLSQQSATSAASNGFAVRVRLEQPTQNFLMSEKQSDTDEEEDKETQDKGDEEDDKCPERREEKVIEIDSSDDSETFLLLSAQPTRKHRIIALDSDEGEDDEGMAHKRPRGPRIVDS